MLLPLWPLVRSASTPEEETEVEDLRACLLELADCLRGIPGGFGLRQYRVFVETVSWSGSERGQGTATVDLSEITEGEDNQPPKVDFGEDPEVGFDLHDMSLVTVGPITPDYDTGTTIGGTALSTLAPTPANRNSTVRVRLVGPRFPDGAYFDISSLDHHRGYQYMLRLQRSSGPGEVVTS